MNIKAYRDAMGGTGPMANDWRDKPHRLVYDLCNALEEERKPVWAVFALADIRVHLGYATGEREDIEAFFDDRKCYGLELERVQSQNIPAGFATKRLDLMQQKMKHEAEIARIESELKQFGG